MKLSKTKIIIDLFPIPSPLAHGLILSGLSDIMLMEDRSALLRELHSQVLGKVLEEDGGDKPRFELMTVILMKKDR